MATAQQRGVQQSDINQADISIPTMYGYGKMWFQATAHNVTKPPLI